MAICLNRATAKITATLGGSRYFYVFFYNLLFINQMSPNFVEITYI